MFKAWRERDQTKMQCRRMYQHCIQKRRSLQKTCCNSYLRQQCEEEGCTNYVVNGGLCIRHGAIVAPKKKCTIEGCTNNAYNSGVCIRHGAKKKNGKEIRRRCSAEECTNFIQKDGVCMRHGAKVTKQIRSKCSEKGCTNFAQIGGVCVRHGAKTKPRKSCIYEDCTNVVVRRGLCRGHGACDDEDITNTQRRNPNVSECNQYNRYDIHCIV